MDGASSWTDLPACRVLLKNEAGLFYFRLFFFLAAFANRLETTLGILFQIFSAKVYLKVLPVGKLCINSFWLISFLPDFLAFLDCLFSFYVIAKKVLEE